MRVVENQNEVNQSYFYELLKQKSNEYNAYIKRNFDGDDDHSELIIDMVECRANGVVANFLNGNKMCIEFIGEFGARATIKLLGKEEQDFLIGLIDESDDFESQFIVALLTKLRKFGDNEIVL